MPNRRFSLHIRRGHGGATKGGCPYGGLGHPDAMRYRTAMTLREAALWALRFVALIGVLSFWAQARWDMLHPPIYHGLHGAESP
jgi:hypothetical protein